MLTLTIAASSGSLQMAQNDSVTIVPGFDGSAGTIRVTGTLAGINAALNGIFTYTPGGDGQNTLTMSVNGQSGAAFEVLRVDTTQDPPAVDVEHASGLDGTINNVGEIGIANSTLTGGLAPITFINSGIINTSGADAFHNVNITNSGGTLHVDAPGTLTLDVGTTITGGTVNIDNGDTLVLNDATLTGGSGAISINNSGTIDVTGNSSISAANLDQTNTGQLTVEANQTLTLDGDTVTNSGAVTVSSGAGLVAKNGTAITDSAIGDTITVNGTGSLTLDDTSSISGGTVTVAASTGTLTLNGTSGDQRRHAEQFGHGDDDRDRHDRHRDD